MSNFVKDLINPHTELKLIVGLYFGSFNPVHIGHMAIANYMAEFAKINQLWFVVSPQNPLKNKANLLEDYHRLEMVRKAVESDDRLRASDIEFKMPKPSYTIDTLTYLKEKYPDYQFKIIMGSDNLENLHKWKNYETLISNYQIIVYPRPGFDTTDYENNTNFEIVHSPLMEISSSFIRKNIGEGKDLRHFMPKAAWQYLDEMNFYK